MKSLRVWMMLAALLALTSPARATFPPLAAVQAVVAAQEPYQSTPVCPFARCLDCDEQEAPCWLAQALRQSLSAWQRVRALCAAEGENCQKCAPGCPKAAFETCKDACQGTCPTSRASVKPCTAGPAAAAACCCAKACACCETCQPKQESVRRTTTPLTLWGSLSLDLDWKIGTGTPPTPPYAVPPVGAGLPVPPPLPVWVHAPVPAFAPRGMSEPLPMPAACPVLHPQHTGFPFPLVNVTGTVTNGNARQAHLVTPELEAHCERMVHSGDVIVLEGDVRLVSRKHGKLVRIEAHRVIVNTASSTYTVESDVPAPTTNRSSAVSMPVHGVSCETVRPVGHVDHDPYRPILILPVPAHTFPLPVDPTRDAAPRYVR
jgi:hypothetical protein